MAGLEPVRVVEGATPVGSPSTRDAAGGRARRGRPWRVGRRAELVLRCGPALVLFALFVLVPIGLAAYHSLFNWVGFGPRTFTGLHNYSVAVKDPVFRSAILHNIIIAALSVAIQLPISISLALLLNRKLKGQAVMRLLIFAPYVVSEAISAVIWLLILQPGGFADQALRAAGLGSLVQLWLGNPHVVLYTMFAVITWKYIGFGIILLLAGLQGIPPELREAAAIDGATSAQLTRHVTLPLLAPTIRIWVFLSVVGSLQLFDLVWIMTAGGPANASSTMVTYLIHNGFNSYEFGYGSAVAVILFVVCFVFALVYQRFALRRDTAGALTAMAGAGR
jgi:raffinose/stachyose/melibiose transport system permease protein